MPLLSSMRTRLVLACLLFATVVALLFAVIASAAVDAVEVRLVDERLAEVARWVAPRYAGHLPLEMPAGLSFHHNADIPRALRNLPDGSSRVTAGGLHLHVYTGHDAGGNFVVVDHNSAYDSIEQTICHMLAAGVACFLVAALLFGAFVGTGVLSRVARLGRSVQEQRDDPGLLREPDELGVLARAFSARTSELTGVLERERCFTGDVSHALQMPLAAINDAASILMMQTDADPLLHRTAARIDRAAQDAVNAIAVLLRLARAPDPLASVPLSVAGLAAAECRRYQALTTARPLTLTCDVQSDFTVRAPRELLVALIGNLIRHACLRTTAGDVRICLVGRTLVVEDTGAPLPPAAVARLGGMAIPEHERGSAGTGLGLALAQRICAYIRADLAYTVREAGGSRFTIHFAGPG